MMAAYPIELAPDDNGTFLVTSPAFPEVTTYGEDRENALVAAKLAIEEAIAARIAEGSEVPVGARWGNHAQDWVQMDALTLAKISLYRTLGQRQVTRAELARRLGWHREQVDRLFRIGHASRLDQLESAFRALGYELDLKLVEAA